MSHRFALRWCAEDLPWSDHADLIGDALRNHLTVSFWLCRGDPEPAFRLSGAPGALKVYASDGRCIGVFADLDAALARGWESGWLLGLPDVPLGTVGERVAGMGV